MSDKEQRRRSRRKKRQDIRDTLRSEGLKVNLRNVLGERGHRFFMKHHPEYAKWKEFREEKPRQVQVSVYGSPIPRNYGTQRHKCNVIWSTRIQPDTDSQPGLIQGEAEFVERWKASWAVSVCVGEQGALLRVWMNGVLVYDFSQSSADQYSSHPRFGGKITFYPGSETQNADPVIEADKGAGNAPDYRGTCYLVFRDLPLQLFDNELPEVEAEVCSLATPDYSTTNVGIVVPEGADIENFLLSRTSPTLYQYSAGQLTIVRRRVAAIYQEIDVQSALDSLAPGCDVVGTLTIDEDNPGAVDPIYLPCSTGSAGFILRYDGAFTSSYSSRITGAVETSCFVHGDKLYTADGAGSKIRCYDKTTLALQWTRSAPVPGLSPGNFTVDNSGFVWLVWEDTGDPDTLYLTRISPGGVIRHNSISQASGSARGILYDATLNVLLTGGVDGNRVCKVSCGASPAVITSVTGRTGYFCGPLFTGQYRSKNSSWWCDGTNLYRLRHSDLSLKKSIALSSYADTGTGNEAYGYGQVERSVWICRDLGPALSKLPLDRYNKAAAALDVVVSDLCTAAGLETSDIDVTDLASVDVAGYKIPDRSTAESPLEALLTAYGLGVREHFESGYPKVKLEFIRRSAQSSAGTITEDLLGIGDGAPQDEVLQEEWINEEELPRRVNVKYADVARDYDSHVQKTEIASDITVAEREYNLDLPNLVLSDDEAKQLADCLAASVWIEGATKNLTLPLQFLWIEPEDIITVTYGSVSHVLRVETVELGANWILQVSGVVCAAEGYSSASSGTAATPADNPVTSPSPTYLVLLDLPALRDIDGVPSDAGHYAVGAPSQTDDSWIGARIRRSADGDNYVSVGTLTNAATLGTTTTALTSGATTTTYDSDSTVTVCVQSGTFPTVTEAEIYDDKLTNLVAVGSESAGWELCQYTTATDLGGGLYRLTGFYRGRFGTERFVDSHAEGELVVLLDFATPTVARIKLRLRNRNETFFYKGVSLGLPAESGAAREFTNTALGLTPYSVAQVSGVHNSPSANDWTINFIRRSRLGQELIDFFDSAVNEETEEYEIEIRDGVSSAVLRTLTIGPGLPALSGVNLSATSGTQLITRASGSWLTDGFLVGQQVDLAGFSNTDNNARFVISALTATDMTLTNGATSLVTEASGAGKTVTAVTPAALYTAAMQATDGGSKSSFYATIYQISARLREDDGVGRGIGVQTLIS